MLKKYKKYLKYIFIAIIGYAIFLRLYNLGVQSFWIDEGFSSYVSKQLFENGINFMKPEYFLHNISQVLSFSIFGVSDFSARLPSVIFSTLNIGLIYLISFSLFRDKKQAIFSTLIFSFLTWEIIWARQARFYALLQFLFCFNIYIIIKIIKDFSFKYFNIAIVSLYIGALFHPFLYSSIVIFVLSLIYLFFINRKKIKFDLKKYHIKKIFFTIFLVICIVIFEYFRRKIFIYNSGPQIKYILSFKGFIRNLKDYLFHFYQEFGFILPVSLLGMFLLAIKKKILESIIITFNFIFILFVISYKGVLFHTRYVFILYPLIIISFSYIVFYFYGKIKDYIFKYLYILFVVLILITGKFTFFPKTYYYIDYTSPQPNFKEAYNKIPNNSDVISGFPMLCKWYYGKRGNCLYSIAVDYTGLPYSKRIVLQRKKDNYTKIPYLISEKQLLSIGKYYFVLDDLTYRGLILKKLFRNIISNSKIIYNNGKFYNNIKVFVYEK